MLATNLKHLLRPLTSRCQTQPLLCSLNSIRSTSVAAQESSAVSEATPEQGPTDQGRPDDLYRYLWIKCAAHNSEVLDSYETFLKMAATHLKVKHVTTESPFRTIYRKTLLASRHVHKKYRVQYEWRDYNRHLLFENITGSTLATYLEYVERNIPEGVLFIAEKHRLAELPFDLEENKET